MTRDSEDNIRETIHWLLNKHEGRLGGHTMTVEQAAALQDLVKKLDATTANYVSGALSAVEAIAQVTLLLEGFHSDAK